MTTTLGISLKKSCLLCFVQPLAMFFVVIPIDMWSVLYNVESLVFGNDKELEINARFFGKINDEEKLALLYSAADLFILPSKEDNLPNVMLESIACGTPVIGFDIGGLSDVIKNYKTGYLYVEKIS